MRRIFLIFLGLLPAMAFAQRDWSQVEIEVTKLSEGIYRLFVANSVAVVSSHGSDGILVIDAAYSQSADKLRNEILALGGNDIRMLINTHLHADHTGGNLVIGGGATIIAHPSVRETLSKEQQRGETVIPPLPENALPTVFVEDKMDMEFNGEKIQITHLPGGHTRGDLIVYFSGSGILVMGDLLFAGYFPFVDINNGGNPLTFLENVARILTHFPSETILVGGHGPVFSMEDLQLWHQQLTVTMELAREAKNNGMTLEGMKSERILIEWEAMGSFFITEDRWLDTIYPYL